MTGICEYCSVDSALGSLSDRIGEYTETFFDLFGWFKSRAEKLWRNYDIKEEEFEKDENLKKEKLDKIEKEWEIRRKEDPTYGESPPKEDL